MIDNGNRINIADLTRVIPVIPVVGFLLAASCEFTFLLLLGVRPQDILDVSDLFRMAAMFILPTWPLMAFGMLMSYVLRRPPVKQAVGCAPSAPSTPITQHKRSGSARPRAGAARRRVPRLDSGKNRKVGKPFRMCPTADSYQGHLDPGFPARHFARFPARAAPKRDAATAPRFDSRGFPRAAWHQGKARKDKSAGELRQERCRDGKAARRMLAIALVLDGVDRKTAAENCGMDRIGPTVTMRRACRACSTVATAFGGNGSGGSRPRADGVVRRIDQTQDRRALRRPNSGKHKPGLSASSPAAEIRPGCTFKKTSPQR